jgi:putative heme-binding domain-containing protein
MPCAWIGRICVLILICMALPSEARTSGTTSAQELFKTHCAACHGSRGPTLRVPVLKRANDLESMVSLLRRGVEGTEMRAIPPLVVGDENLRRLASYVLAFRTHTQEAASGRTDRGAEIFRTKGKCPDCHRVNGMGRTLAPDLSEIGRQRDLSWLKRALLEPEAEIFDSFYEYRWAILLPENYLLIDLRTKSGEEITGPRVNEDPFSIQIRDGKGRLRSFLKSELVELRKSWGKSPMRSYKGVLPSAEIDDLVAYLASLRGIK